MIKIWGGPGCGKTTKQMEFYETFLQKGYTPSDITAITFRTTSAEDLINGVVAKTQTDKKTVKTHVGTIHSICNRLVGFNELISPKEINQFAKQHKYLPYMKSKSQFIDDEDKAYSGDLFDLYTWLRNTQTPVEKWYLYPGFSEIKLPDEKIPDFVNDYEHFKKEINKIDYTDMLQRIIDEKTPLDTPVLMVDEFQDLTTQMYRIFENWAPKCEYVIVAGDPLQSIYGFWGGSPDHYLNWQANEVILKQSHRLPSQVWDFASRILELEGMKVPEIKAKTGFVDPIKYIDWDVTTPSYSSELHLVRCNYQAYPIAMKLAQEGKMFGGLNGWTQEEMNLASAVISFRSWKPLTLDHLTTLVKYYPLPIFGVKGSKDDLIGKMKKSYNPATSLIRTGQGFITNRLIDSLLSYDPTYAMATDNKLLAAKINGIKDSSTYIPFIKIDELNKRYMPRFNRNILTFHGSKGLEAQAVFLHTGITKRIENALVIPGEESAAEARVWYVGATRAKDALYIISDEGKKYSLPEVAVC
jgi:hypothetical protein